MIERFPYPTVPDDLALLLAMWHNAQQHGATAQMGYPTECPSTKGYRPKGWRDDVLESDVRATVVAAIEQVVSTMPRPQRIAAQIMARNAATGSTVWASAALPDDPLERAQVFSDTINAMCVRMGLTSSDSAGASHAEE